MQLVCVCVFVQVIYVKPGYQADLDSLVQDTIRLTTAVKVINIKSLLSAVALIFFLNVDVLLKSCGLREINTNSFKLYNLKACPYKKKNESIHINY